MFPNCFSALEYWIYQVLFSLMYQYAVISCHNTAFSVDQCASNLPIFMALPSKLYTNEDPSHHPSLPVHMSRNYHLMGCFILGLMPTTIIFQVWRMTGRGFYQLVGGNKEQWSYLSDKITMNIPVKEEYTITNLYQLMNSLVITEEVTPSLPLEGIAPLILTPY